MGDLFGAQWHGEPFRLLDVSHLTLLALLAVATALVVTLGPRLVSRTRRVVELVVGWILLLNTAGWHLWNAALGLWDVQEMLPLHLCALMSFVTAFALFTRRPLLAALAWLIGTPGALMALATPEVAPYGFPHYRVIQSWLQHGILWLAGFWLVFADDIRPTWRHARQSWLALHLTAPVVFVINLVLGSNYLFINRKPEFASALSAMPPWPTYLLVLEVIVVAVIVLFWLIAGARRAVVAQLRPGSTTAS